MKYIPIPGLKAPVSAVSLGMAELGAALPEAEGWRLLDAYLDLGGNLIDTARVYSDWVPGERGRSERALGDYLAARGCRGRVLLATKGAHPDLAAMDKPRMARAQVEGDLNLSLAALRTDVIDLYYLHRDDPSRPVEEILAMLEDFVRAGKIRRYACSNWRADRMLQAHTHARTKGLQGFAANQVFWNLASRNSLPLTDPTCVCYDGALRRAFDATGILPAAYSSQAGGFFAKLDRGDDVSGSPYFTPGNLRIFEAAKGIAARTGLTMTDITLSYILSQPFCALAVVGCRSVEQLEQTLAAAEKPLAPEDLTVLEHAAAPIPDPGGPWPQKP